MKIISDSVSSTLKIGQALAKKLGKGDIICLYGELGSGKTVLTKGIAKTLGVKAENVISPSFVLIREHKKAKIPLYHFDLYRLDSFEDMLALGYEEYFFDEGLSVVEWADRLGCLLPKERLSIYLKAMSGTKRSLEFRAQGSRYQKILKGLNEDFRH